MNQIVLMGRLTRDPELRHTQSGTPVASFSLAVDRGYVSKDSGERQTDFIDIVAWRSTGEFVSKYFTKGQMAAVTGRLQIRDWTDKEGNKRRSAEVVADNIYFTESKRSRDAAAGAGAYAPPGGASPYAEPKSADYSTDYASPVAPSEFSELDEDDGDLPF
jgi:single-strand DNA-binding protein